jgi:hypothetical protein
MHRIITLSEAINNLINLYRFIDIRSIVCRKDLKSEWLCVFSKIRLTDDDNEEIKRLHTGHLQNLGVEENKQRRFRFLYECRDIQDVNSVINEIFNNQLTVNGITSRLQTGTNKGVEGIEVQKYDYYSTIEERKGYHHWFIFLPNSGNGSTYKLLSDLAITVEEIGSELEFLNAFFDISSTEWNKNTNNLALLMPIYIKRSEIFRVEKQKTLVKYLIHKELITVCTARKIVHYKDNVKILKLDLPDLTEAEGSSQIVPIMLSIDNKEFPKMR